MRRSPWLAVPVSLVSKFIIAVLLVFMLTSAGMSLPTLSPRDGASWYILMAANVLSAVGAGAICARLSSPRDRVAPAVVAFFMLVPAVAATPPSGANVLQLLLWALGAPVGIAIGTWLLWRWKNGTPGSSA